jgi:diguanylate cyclase (GGDEF)-like protein
MPASNPSHALRVLCLSTGDPRDWEAPLAALERSPWGPFEVERCASYEAAAQRLAQAPVDAVLAALPATPWPGLSQAALNAAVVLVAPQRVAPEMAARLLSLGVQDVLPGLEATHEDTLARTLRLAVERKRIEREARKAYATDLATGLPNHTQLVEHMSHLLALREREPAPMALLVLRLEGLQTTEAQLGRESANVLRRKVAVRLRAGVRASDVVASLGGDSFAVLLSAIEEAAHAQRVVQKLSTALLQPFNVAGHGVGVAVGIGVGLYPQDGKQADALLRRATGAAAIAPAAGRAGFANRLEGGMPQAANDDDASSA